jgi:hypothetical protein
LDSARHFLRTHDALVITGLWQIDATQVTLSGRAMRRSTRRSRLSRAGWGLRRSRCAGFREPLDYAFENQAAVLVLRGLAQECRQTRTGLLLLLPIELDDAVAQDAIRAAAVDGVVAYSLPDDAPCCGRPATRAAAGGH